MADEIENRVLTTKETMDLHELGVLAWNKLPFDNLNSLRAELFKEFPEINNFDQVTENSGKALKVTKLGEATFKYAISDHYLTNPIARASEVMALYLTR